jgi:hypothetical protein
MHSRLSTPSPILFPINPSHKPPLTQSLPFSPPSIFLPLRKALRQGLAGPFLVKLSSQPQITAAYSPSAPVRDKALLKAAATLLQDLKVGEIECVCERGGERECVCERERLIPLVSTSETTFFSLPHFPPPHISSLPLSFFAADRRGSPSSKSQQRQWPHRMPQPEEQKLLLMRLRLLLLLRGMGPRLQGGQGQHRWDKGEPVRAVLLRT